MDGKTGGILGTLPVVVNWDQDWTPRRFGELNWREGP